MLHRPPRALFASLLGCLLFVGVVVGQERLLEAIQARLAANPADPAALEELGVEHLRRGDYTQAFIQLQKALAVDSLRGTTHYYLGLVYFEKGLYNKEIGAYQKAILLLPDFAPARLNLAHAYLSAGKIPEAVEQYEWVRRRDSGNLTVLYNLGLVLADLDRPAEARAYLTEYLQLAPASHSGRAGAAGVLAEIDQQPRGNR